MLEIRKVCGKSRAYVFDNHHKERQLNAQNFLWVGRTSNIGRANIGSHDLEDG
jgi:hypothetical protein